MARQYYTGPLADSLIVPQSAVSPATTTTSIFAINQANKFLPLPYGQNAPSPGSIFRVRFGGLCTTVASTSNVGFNIYHGPGTTATAFGTALASSSLFTTVAATAGNWDVDGILIYRAVSEATNSSTVWFSGKFIINGPSSGTVTPVTGIIQSTAAVTTCDTTGSGTAGTFGALNIAIIPGTTGSSWTPEFAFIEQVN